jgi:hypothetical protein
VLCAGVTSVVSQMAAHYQTTLIPLGLAGQLTLEWAGCVTQASRLDRCLLQAFFRSQGDACFILPPNHNNGCQPLRTKPETMRWPSGIPKPTLSSPLLPFLLPNVSQLSCLLRRGTLAARRQCLSPASQLQQGQQRG